MVGDALVETVLAGGYPEALTRSGWRRRRDWHLDYIEAIVQRDVREVARIEQLGSMPRLLRVLAEQSGRLVNYSGFGAPLGMNHVTTRKYMGVLEALYLVQALPPWYTNALKRVTKSPKVHFLDAGLLAALRGITPDRLRRDRTPFGAVLETFVLSELLKLASWADDRYTFSHFRDKQRNEVDIVIEDGRGQVVGVEVKGPLPPCPRETSPACAASRQPPARASPSGWCCTTMKRPCRLERGWPPLRSRPCGRDEEARRSEDW